MKNLLRAVAAVRACLALLFAVALALIAIATRVGWDACHGGLDQSAAARLLGSVSAAQPLCRGIGA
jgi:hypothetical protein